MNCTICGLPFVLGNLDLHKNCDKILRQRQERDQEIDEMLDWFREFKLKRYIPPAPEAPRQGTQ